MKHPGRCQPSLCAERCDSHPGISLAAATGAREGRDEALRSQTRSRLLARRQGNSAARPANLLPAALAKARPCCPRLTPQLSPRGRTGALGTAGHGRGQRGPRRGA